MDEEPVVPIPFYMDESAAIHADAWNRLRKMVHGGPTVTGRTPSEPAFQWFDVGAQSTVAVPGSFTNTLVDLSGVEQRVKCTYMSGRSLGKSWMPYILAFREMLDDETKPRHHWPPYKLTRLGEFVASLFENYEEVEAHRPF